jgi:hypothetical protein
VWVSEVWGVPVDLSKGTRGLILIREVALQDLVLTGQVQEVGRVLAARVNCVL